ncbi:MAG: TldD/PmbA family protein [Thermoplasmata archaeon]|nr:MAG: TldD/PmbA family protein [Thermoplasmata archaeon]
MFDGWIDSATRGGASYADLRVLRVENTRLELKDGELKEAVEGGEAGFGLRVLVDGSWGFASANSLDPREGEAAVERALSLARATATRAGEPVVLAPAPVVTDRVVWDPEVDPLDVAIEDKLELLRDMEVAARESEHLATVTTAYMEGMRRVEFLTSEGTRLEHGLTRIIATSNLTGRKEGVISSFRTRVGGVGGYEVLTEGDPVAVTAEGVRSLETLLEAGRAPGGRMTAIVDPDMTGVLVHEAFGHASEADLVLAGESILDGRMGEKLGADGVTIFDDPTMAGGFGSFPYDDEGVMGSRKVLMEDGVLTSFIHSRETAGRMGDEPNGAARAQDHSSRPLVRMSNTCMAAGDMSHEEIFEGVKEGIYVKGTRGGEVDPAKGTFQFGAQEAFLVEDGEVTRPLRDVALMGSILETLLNVDGIGKDFKLASPGFCGKGQTVPVCDGGPHVRFRDAVVGGG